MSTPPSLANEIGLLRRIAENVATKPAPQKRSRITEDDLRAGGFFWARQSPDGLCGILRPGNEPFNEFAEKLFSSSPKMERGTSFSAFQEELFVILTSDYLGRDPMQIGEADVLALQERLAFWFKERAAKRTIFVPCMISPWPSPRFSIGPVTFLFIEDVVKSEYYLDLRAQSPSAGGLDRLIEAMGKERAHWLAVVNIDDCDRERGYEIGDLAVDLALVALQLAAPGLDTRNISRLATRRGPGMKVFLSVSAGRETGGFSNTEPGLSIGNGYLGHIIRETNTVISAVGKCVQSFATGNFRLPKLEQAWCDAAYWLHQGLAEPIDSIAVAKLETAIEVLLHAESSAGSEGRILAAMDTFYSLKPDDPITPSSPITTKAFAKRFVRDRSRVLHGTWSTLSVRLSGSRDSLADLARTLVRSTAQELELYFQSSAAADDTQTFLNWVKHRRQRI
ncbi:hypothetical protein [Rhizobium sp. C1]|uniref:hypothetical protein n=1 Tax=Rhizobium sp. C1 TaxID=1349799 RepID=UPI001E4D37BE|nr:hypothetical protein [Rhizobium sp. C1]MCD2176482.1 hypothetical protein [Rhizobium sp. C1]